MLRNGYVKLYRSLMDWEWFADSYTTYLFIYLIMTVSIEDSQWHGITIKRGQRVSSIATLARETNASEKKVRTAILRLERAGSVARSKYPKFTVFTVLNFDKFQQGADKTEDKRQGRGRVRAGKGQEYKKIKNIKEDKEINTAPALEARRDGGDDQIFDFTDTGRVHYDNNGGA